MRWVLPLLLTSACTVTQAIRPAELAKLNGSHVVATQDSVIFTRTAVEAPDGTLVDVSGEFDALVTVKSRGALVFEHPVRTEVDEDRLRITASNRAPTDLRLVDIHSTRVRQYSPGRTIALTIGLSLASVAASAVFIFATLPE